MADRILQGPPFKSPTFLEELNQNQTFGKYVLSHAEKMQNRICAIDAVNQEQLSIRDTIDRSRNLAMRLLSLRERRDTVVGIVSENRLEYLPAVLGSSLAGMITTFFNPQYSIAEMQHTFGISRPTIVFSSSACYEKVLRIKNLIPSIKYVILMDTENVDAESKLLFSDLVKPVENELTLPQRSPDDAALILYSSGTTGYPKGVTLTNRNIIFMLKVIRYENILEFEGRYTIGTLPMFHAYGLFLILLTLVIDETLIVIRHFDPRVFLKIIQDFKVKFLFLVPTLVTFLLKSPLTQHYDLSSLSHFFCGAAPLRSETEEEIRRKLNVDCIRQGYGMTEATFGSLMKSKVNRKIGSCGSLINGIQAKVVDINTRKTLTAYEKGELQLKGPHIMKGYYGDEKSTKNTIDEDGWLQTGDVGYYDSDQDFFIVDRVKELIKYKGFQVAPAELEALLLKHKHVSDVAVIGIPDDIADELPRAFVVKQKGSNVTEADLVNYVAGLVTSSKRLRGGVVFVDEIPKTPSGKILRRALRDRSANLKSKY